MAEVSEYSPEEKKNLRSEILDGFCLNDNHMNLVLSDEDYALMNAPTCRQNNSCSNKSEISA